MTTPSKSSFPRGLALVLVALAAFFIGRKFSSPEPAPEHTGQAAEAESTVPEVWTCSMHPQVRMSEPGSCPFCGMDLIPADTGGGDDVGISELRMSEGAMMRAKIQTDRVRFLNLAHEIPLVGKVSLDETRVATITSWVDGRLDRLFVDYTGTEVRKGDHLAEIYSPILYSAQEELLQAIVASAKVASSEIDLLRESTERTIESARERLRLFGLDDEQIARIEVRGEPDEHMTLTAPIGGVVIHKNALEGMFVKEGTDIVRIADLSKVWVTLDAYESDLAWLRYGQLVTFNVESYPGQFFEGRIAFIDPVLNPMTRTVKVRLNVDNSDRRLKPDMFVSATAEALLSSSGRVVDESLAGKWMCPMHPEVVGDGPEPCRECGMALVPVEELGFEIHQEMALSLAVPDTAPLFTGRRSVVYVSLPDKDMPSFEGREVVLGPHAGDYYVVLEGLEEGEEVVVQGNFKIDSELQIRAKRSMMAPDVGRKGARPVSQPSAGPPLKVSDEFRAQLGRLLEAYLVLADELAEDQLNEAAQKGLAQAFNAIDMDSLEGRTHRAWMEVSQDLHDGVDKVAVAKDLEATRAGFGPLSASLMSALETFGFEAPEAPLAVFHCPMAYDMAGADWIAPDGATRNPYFGLDMQKCGDITGPFGAPAAQAGESEMEMHDMDMGEPEAAAPTEVTPEFQAQLSDLVDAYLSLERTLFADADSPAMRAALLARFEEINMGGLAGEAHMAWMKGSPDLRAAIEGMISSEGIEGARAALAPLSEQLVLAIDHFGLPAKAGDRGPLAVFHCPMALDFEGADWLGESGPIRNPFFGSEMPGCGSLVRELEQGGER